MDKGKIPINKQYELEYRYYDKDNAFKYFNRRFEVYLCEKKPLKTTYLLHMDNSDYKQMTPSVYKATHGRKKFNFGVTTLNWNDIKNTFLDYVVEEIGEENRTSAKKALSNLSSPKL
ncbi:MAG: hypothetical protein QCI00_01925 [Candidatus Thermoplasmatota archaeon]|nr:hypothetical protein [Candidatus Thermoplasmatota archaeon]